MKAIAVLVLCATLFCQGYSNLLDSCQGRCGYGTDSNFSCQCNPACERYNDCCSDYIEICKGTGEAVTDAELKALSETLYTLDSNKASASELIIDVQTLVSNSETSSEIDRSPKPLFRYVDENALFSKPTYAAVLSVLDNYNRMTGVAEDFSSQQLAEQEKFVRETMSNTDLGREFFAFLYTKGIYKSEEEFIEDLKMMWFGLYSRNKQLDSSGFEHIFAGEIKGGKVSGFHNWIQFYLVERSGKLNYYSHSFNGPWTTYPDVLGMQFMWDGYYKQVGSSVIGSSPEFDFAIYSLCYITRPGKQCHLSVGGNELIIQTYTWDNSFYGDGKKFIGSAYPSTP